MTDYMLPKTVSGDVCPYCEFEVGDYCSRCGKPLSESAKALDYRLHQELPEEWEL